MQIAVKAAEQSLWSMTCREIRPRDFATASPLAIAISSACMTSATGSLTMPLTVTDLWPSAFSQDAQPATLVFGSTEASAKMVTSGLFIG